MINYIDSSDKPECNNVKFISYTGAWPNLCNGILILEIDGEEVKFGHDYARLNSYEKDSEGRLVADGNYDSFWTSGGSCGFYNGYSDSYVNSGEWIIEEFKLNEKFKPYIKEIDEVFNANVPHGCCGGCL